MSAYIGNKEAAIGVYVETDRVVLSRAEYDALEVKDDNTLYLINDDPTVDEVTEHIDDISIHVTPEEKKKWNAPQINTDDIANLHVWSLSDAEGNISYLTGTTINDYTEGALSPIEAHIDMVEMTNVVFFKMPVDNGMGFNYGTATVDNTGWISMTKIGSYEASLSASNIFTHLNQAKGNYLYILANYASQITYTDLDMGPTNIYFLPSDAEITQSGTNNNYTITFSKLYKCVGVPYSSGGECIYLGQLGEGGSKIATGTYSGTGSNKTLNLGFELKLLIIQSDIYNTNNNYMTGAIWSWGNANGYSIASTSDSSVSFKTQTSLCTVNGNSATINKSLCASGYRYHYTAIGI